MHSNPIARLIKLVFVESPIYPHWLDFRHLNSANRILFSHMRGDVLETGCGNAEVKHYVLKKYGKKVDSYLATDYSSWDPLFDNQTKKMKRFGAITRILYGKPKEPEQVDKVVDALKLPFKSNSFDTYASFEVLEHIDYPEKFFAEASRVLRKKGKMLVSVPFMYREHSDGTGYDYHRFTVSCLKKLCTDHGLEPTKVFTHSYFGTASAALINQFWVRKIAEGNFLIKIILIIPAPFIFIFTNCIGFVIDKIDHDERFASHYHLIATKK
jgi:SAM-dependent methyltransferase